MQAIAFLFSDNTEKSVVKMPFVIRELRRKSHKTKMQPCSHYRHRTNAYTF